MGVRRSPTGLLYFGTILTTLAMLVAAPVGLIGVGIGWLRSKRITKPMLIALVRPAAYIVGALIGWAFRPFNWSISFMDTLRAQTADHSITQNNMEGYFIIPGLLPGMCTLSIESGGCKVYKQSGGRLHSGEVRALGQITLALGEVAEVVSSLYEIGCQAFRFLAVALWLLLAVPLISAEIPWPVASPPEAGIHLPAMEAFKNELAVRGTKNLLVIRYGKIAYEWYASDSGPAKTHYTASMAKALVGGMSLLAALNDGRMAVDDAAEKYIPAWRSDPLKSKITIRHLATHSSGIEDAEEGSKPHNELTGWKGAFWKRDPNPFLISLTQAPVLFEPGSKFHYSNTGMAALAYAVTASLRGAPHSDIRTLLRERVMAPLGVPDDQWNIGYGRAYEVDGLKLYANWGGGNFTARATARVGQLMLQRGVWDGRPLFRANWVERMVKPAGTPPSDRTGGEPAPASGLCWWVNADGIWKAVPKDAFVGAGAGHQILLVVPSLSLVAVRNGGPLSGKGGRQGYWSAAYEHFLAPLMATLDLAPPYPPSPVIRKVTFDPESSIVRQAIDSDNWPITWMDDDTQFTAYGDGWGFDPRTDKKLSLGFAQIMGPAESFRAVNVRSPTGERTGEGKAGPKASGMLMVDGVLYMWVRNTGNSQLVWSEDRGRTWRWGFKFDTSFGSPAFLNMGKNYQGARDHYVYVYSQDGPSAYESYDHLVLARAPKDRLRERAAWEFFVRLDGANRPVWTKDIAQRGPVFTYWKNCQRVDAVYNPGLKRYLLALGYNHHGGWGLFDAAEPWGPWTTAFHTIHWGLGGTHGYRLPAKWISTDGATMYLIFSGVRPYDAFCVRRFTLEK